MEHQEEEEGKVDNKFSVVASFMQSISNERVFQTHVPSLHVDLHSYKNNDAAANKGGSQPIIRWPKKKMNDGSTNNNHDEQPHHPEEALSTLKFIGDFLPEDHSQIHSSSSEGEEEEQQRYYIPKTCPINLSILRNGRMMTIGSINLIVNGTENGLYSINVPIRNTIKQNYKLNKAGGGEISTSKRSNMARIKGDVYKFGIAQDAMIRVLIKVTTPQAVLPNNNSINRFGASDAAVQNYTSTTIEEEDDEDEEIDLIQSLQDQLDQKDATIQAQQKELVESKNTFLWTLRQYNKTIQSLRNELDMMVHEQQQNKRFLQLNSQAAASSCGMMMTNPQQSNGNGSSILSRVHMLQQQAPSPKLSLPLSISSI